MTEDDHAPPIAHPGRLLKRELAVRMLSAHRLSLDIGVPSRSITDILNHRRSITADTAVRLGHYFGNNAQFWLDLQRQYDIACGAVKWQRNHAAGTARRCGIIESIPIALNSPERNTDQ
jgi:antitoxin HigA-1